LLNTTVFNPDIGLNLILSGNCNKTANINVKIEVFNGDTTYMTQLKQHKSKRCYLYVGAR